MKIVLWACFCVCYFGAVRQRSAQVGKIRHVIEVMNIHRTWHWHVMRVVAACLLEQYFILCLSHPESSQSISTGPVHDIVGVHFPQSAIWIKDSHWYFQALWSTLYRWPVSPAMGQCLRINTLFQWSATPLLENHIALCSPELYRIEYTMKGHWDHKSAIFYNTQVCQSWSQVVIFNMHTIHRVKI